MNERVSIESSEEFAGRLLGVLNAGMLALMTSIGHRTSLFDVMASLAPSTSAQVAERAGLDERYVREWLGAMTIGGIVDHDPTALTFALPPEHAAWLTRAAGPDNLAVQAQTWDCWRRWRTRSCTASAMEVVCPMTSSPSSSHHG